MGSSPGSAFPEDRPIPWFRRGLTTAVLPIGLVLLWLAHFQPGLVEEHYSNGLFPVVRDWLRSFFGHWPFDAAQGLLILIAIAVPLEIVRGLLALLKRNRSLANLLAHAVSRILSSAGVLYGLFLVTWGMNHARMPYARVLGLETTAGASIELRTMTEELIARCNALREDVADEDLLLSAEGVDARVLRGYERLAQEVPTLASGTPLVRRAYMSPMLSALGISGIYSPFTAESHVNVEMPQWRHGFVCAHEIAHFKGFAREDEANFISWQVCRASGDPALEYSATLTAALHCINALGREDPFRAGMLRDSFSDAVRADLDWSKRFWREKRTKATKVAKVANDTYLKSQGQPAGRQSYGRMVELLIAEWKGAQPEGGDE
jgi:hypothetical protein